MLHKAWNSNGEMPFCVPRSSVIFQGHTVQNITDFDPNWALPDYRPVAAFKSLRFALLSFLVVSTTIWNYIHFHMKWNPIEIDWNQWSIICPHQYQHSFYSMDHNIMPIKMAIMNIEIISCALNCMYSIMIWNAVISCTTKFGYNEYVASQI